ncbi:hypothetical protein CHELA17_40314 [Chelatococcus asaccharovorans]|nr:hypothetical protein CHELA17_40314 [Chelatococcus asaccharovorans]
MHNEFITTPRPSQRFNFYFCKLTIMSNTGKIYSSF